MFLSRNLESRCVRVNTTRTGPLARIDAFGVLDGEPYTERVWVMENTGYNDYDALNLSIEKRYFERLVGPRSRIRYRSRTGRPENQADKNTYQNADRAQPR